MFRVRLRTDLIGLAARRGGKTKSTVTRQIGYWKTQRLPIAIGPINPFEIILAYNHV